MTMTAAQIMAYTGGEKPYGWGGPFGGWDQLSRAVEQGAGQQLVAQMEPTERAALRAAWDGGIKDQVLAQQRWGLISTEKLRGSLNNLLGQYPELAVLLWAKVAKPDLIKNPVGVAVQAYGFQPPAQPAQPPAAQPPAAQAPALQPGQQGLVGGLTGAPTGAPSAPQPGQPFPYGPENGAYPTIDLNRLYLDIWRTREQLRIAEQQGNADRAQQLNMFLQQLDFQRRNTEFEQGMEFSKMAGNPRNLAQSLFQMGLSQDQVSKMINESPMVQGLWNQWGVQQPTTGGQQPPIEGQPPVEGQPSPYQFIRGRGLPVRQTLEDLRTHSERIPLLAGLSSYGGTTPENFFGEFSEFLPSGQTAGLTHYK